MQSTANEQTVDGSRRPVDPADCEPAAGHCCAPEEDCDVPLMVGDDRPPGDWREPQGPVAILDVLGRHHRNYDQWLALCRWFADHGRQAEAAATRLGVPLIVACMDRGMSFNQGLARIAWQAGLIATHHSGCRKCVLARSPYLGGRSRRRYSSVTGTK